MSTFILDKLVFQETLPIYVIFNLLVSFICIMSGYLYAYMAAFRGTDNHSLDFNEKIALSLEIIFTTHIVL